MTKQYSFQYTWKTPGKSLLVLWAIHGNETCWPIAIHNIIKKITNNELIIKSGTVTFVPICNEVAHNKWVRQIDKNLNRIFNFSGKAWCYEETLVKPLQKLIQHHDYLLDIHSISWWDARFLFENNSDARTIALWQATWIYSVIHGRDNLYDESGWTTDQYAASIWKSWICIECGNHNNPKAPTIAYNAIIWCMRHLWIINWETTQTQNRIIYTMKALFTKKSEGHFTQHFQHGDKIKRWDILCNYDNGNTITSPINWYILLPKHRAKTWDERFYLATAAEKNNLKQYHHN